MHWVHLTACHYKPLHVAGHNRPTTAIVTGTDLSNRQQIVVVLGQGSPLRVLRGAVIVVRCVVDGIVVGRLDRIVWCEAFRFYTGPKSQRRALSSK